MRSKVVLALILSIAAWDTALAQEKTQDTGPSPQARFYKLVYRVIETGSDATSSAGRLYAQVISTDRNSPESEIRTGDKIPVETGSNGNRAVSTQFQYIDVGTEIDTSSIQEEGATLQAFVTARVSSVAKAVEQNPALGQQPVIRQCTWKSRVTVPTGKPTIIFSSDNPSDKGKTELELTATLIK